MYRAAVRIGIIPTDNATGVGRVFRRTVETMVRIAPHHEYSLLLASDARAPPSFGGVTPRVYRPRSFPVLGRSLREREIRRVVREEGFDLVHDMANGGLPRIALPAVKLETVHDTVPYVFPDVVPPSVRRWYRIAIPRVLASADLIITVGNVVKQDLVRFLKLPETKIRVVQNGVDDRFVPIADKAACRKRVGLEFPFLLFLGNIGPKRNVHRLVRAYGTIASRHPGLRLVLGGPHNPQDPYVIELHRITKDLGLTEKVLLPGFVSDEDLPWLYNAAEAFAYIPVYEGFCLPPVEAMGCGTPVVVSDNPPLREVVADGATLVDGSSVEAIAAGLETALEDSAERERLRERGIARARWLSWDRTARGVLAVYDEAAALRSA